DLQAGVPVPAQFHESAPQLAARLRSRHSGSHHDHQTDALADSKSSKPVHASDGRAITEDAGVEGKVQRRSDSDESGVDEALQTVRHQSGRWLFADDDSNPDLFRSL